MRIHRFIGNFDFDNRPSPPKADGRREAFSRLKIFDGEVLNQLKNVLRLKAGDNIILSDGKLNEALSKITDFKKYFVEVEILELSKNRNEPRAEATLYCSILKRENFELVVQKAAEIGVKEIVPIIAKRTVKLNLKRERLEKIIKKEAAEQSGRGIVPVLHPSMQFKEALEHAKQNRLNLFFDPAGESINSLCARPLTLNPSGLFIGPEGGWEKSELKAAKNSDFKIVSLGKLTLRAETAAIIASYLVLMC